MGEKCYENRFYGNFGTDDNEYYSFWKESAEDVNEKQDRGRHINIASGYFKGCRNLEEIKRKYKTLAKDFILMRVVMMKIFKA